MACDRAAKPSAPFCHSTPATVPCSKPEAAAGFLVHPPLAEKETFQIGYEGEGRYQFVYSVNTKGNKWEPIFTVTYLLPMGGIGATKREIKMHIQDTPQTREIAHLMPGMFISQDDMGTPAGAVTLRGAWNFQTPPGWDTVYTPVFNMIERPIAPMLVIRVETDWYVHDSEFRYVLQPGETISASHSMPIGQVIFVPREEITFRDGTEEEIAARHQSSSGVLRRKGEDEGQDAIRIGIQPALSEHEPPEEGDDRTAWRGRSGRSEIAAVYQAAPTLAPPPK